MSSAVLEVQGTITERGQTTVPAPIRQALGIGRRGFIVWRIDPDGAVRVTAADEAEPDPALGRFLALLEQARELEIHDKQGKKAHDPAD